MSDKSSRTCLSCQIHSRIPLLRGRCFFCFENALLLLDAGLTNWETIVAEGFALPNIAGEEKQLLGYVGCNGVAYCQLCDWKIIGSGDSIAKKEAFLHNEVNRHLEDLHDRLFVTRKIHKVNKPKLTARMVYRG